MKAVFPILFMSVCMCRFYTIQQIWFKRSGETSPYIRLYGFIIFTDVFDLSWPSHPQAVFISTGLEINNNYRVKGQTKEREKKKKESLQPLTFPSGPCVWHGTWETHPSQRGTEILTLLILLLNTDDTTDIITTIPTTQLQLQYNMIMSPSAYVLLTNYCYCYYTADSTTINYSVSINPTWCYILQMALLALLLWHYQLPSRFFLNYIQIHSKDKVLTPGGV